MSGLQAFAGIVTVSVGHCHPKVLKAIQDQQQRLQVCSARPCTTRPLCGRPAICALSSRVCCPLLKFWRHAMLHVHATAMMHHHRWAHTVDCIPLSSALCRRAQHTTTIYLHNEIAEFAKELTDRLPGDLKVGATATAVQHSHFCSV